MTEAVYSYFPGCSLVTTAKENNASMINFVSEQSINLIELEDWNCCGSSSAHSIDPCLADRLAMRNLSLAPPDRPLLVACPSCYLRLQQTQIKLKSDKKARSHYRQWFKKSAPLDLKIVHFFDMLEQLDWNAINHGSKNRLKGLKFAPYYGCMLARPPVMRHMKNHHGTMEKILSGLGAEPIPWGYGSRCCGTFLSVVRPDIVTDMVEQIVTNAKYSGADCIVTACAMCHMNLEIRSHSDSTLPIFHFSEILSLSCQNKNNINTYFQRHLINPLPILKQFNIIE